MAWQLKRGTCTNDTFMPSRNGVVHGIRPLPCTESRRQHSLFRCVPGARHCRKEPADQTWRGRDAMNWLSPVDAYCERTGPEYWSEPVNAVTNLAFLIAAVVIWPRLKGRDMAMGRVLASASAGLTWTRPQPGFTDPSLHAAGAGCPHGNTCRIEIARPQRAEHAAPVKTQALRGRNAGSGQDDQAGMRTFAVSRHQGPVLEFLGP
jgi:hypothetical protein